MYGKGLGRKRGPDRLPRGMATAAEDEDCAGAPPGGVWACGWAGEPLSQAGLGERSGSMSLGPCEQGGLGLSSPRHTQGWDKGPDPQLSDSLLCYEDVGPDLIHLVPGDLLAVLDQGPLQVPDAGCSVRVRASHPGPDAAGQVPQQELLGGLQHACTVVLRSGPRGPEP